MNLKQAILKASKEKQEMLSVGIGAHLSGIEYMKANTINFPVKEAYDYATKIAEKYGVTIEEIAEIQQEINEELWDD